MSESNHRSIIMLDDLYHTAYYDVLDDCILSLGKRKGKGRESVLLSRCSGLMWPNLYVWLKVFREGTLVKHFNQKS